MLRGIDHVGIAVEDLDAAVELYRRAFGLAEVRVEDVPEQGVRVALLPLPAGKVELLAPLGPDTPVGRFLARRGPGLHHVAFAVTDLRSALREAEARGLEPIDRRPRQGAGGAWIAFLHPRGTMGTLIELCQRPGPDGPAAAGG